MTARWKAVLYDWDGTLIDSATATYRSYEQLFGAFGIAFDRALFETTYAPDWYQTYRALGLDESAWPQADAMWLRLYRETRPAAMPAAAHALRRVAGAGLTQGIVTSGDRSRVVPEVASFGWSAVLPVLVCAGEAERGKPHPDPLLRALDRIGLDATTVAFVGDSPEDVRMARAAGVHAVGVPGGFPNRQALIDSGPDRLAPDLAAAVEYLLAPA